MDGNHLTTGAFDEFIRVHRHAGQQVLAQALRDMIETSCPGTEPLIARIPDARLLRPELFVHLRDPSEAPGSLAEILWALLPAEDRPPDPPEVDYEPNAVEVPGHPFELVTRPHPTIVSLLPEASSTDLDPRRFQAALQTALDAIRRVDPTYYEELRVCVRTVCLFLHPTANSFADMAGHGCIFINVRWPPSAAFFVEEVCHQGGHVVLRAACLRRYDFLVDPLLPVAQLDAKPGDERILFSAFHGVYTEHMIARVLARLDDEGAGDLDPEEVFARLAQIHDKHRRDLEIVRHPHPRGLTARGRALVDYYAQQWRALGEAKPALDWARPFYGSYEFDYEGYRRQNPSRAELIRAARRTPREDALAHG